MIGMEPGATVADALRGITARLAAAGCVSAGAEARWLLEEVLALPAGGLAARRRERLPTVAADALDAMVERRVAGEPLQYVIGWAPFGALRIEVGAGVFVPRPETELVAHRAAGHLRAAPVPAIAVDLCTGSGAIARYLRAAVPGARLLATEVDQAALAWARRNLAGSGVELLEGDLDGPLPEELRSKVDVLVANVPYVPSGQIPLLPHDVRAHEPLAALDGGAEGLDIFRRVVERAGRWVAPGGWLVCEIGDDHGDAATALLAGAGFEDIAVMPDLTGRIRLIEGRWAR